MRVGWERADLCLPSCTSIFTPPTVPEKASPRPRESTNQGSPTNLKSFQPKSHLEPLPLAVVGQRACPSHVPCSPFHSVLLPVYLITSLVWAPIPTLLLSEGILQGIVPTQGSNLGLLHWWILSPQGRKRRTGNQENKHIQYFKKEFRTENWLNGYCRTVAAESRLWGKHRKQLPYSLG